MIEVAGLELLPQWPVFLSFVLAGLALIVVPGADMTFIITSSARGGQRDGLIAASGIGTGALVHVLAAVAGLSAILAASPIIFTLIKWAGALYLLYIAYSLLRSSPQPQSKRQNQQQLRALKSQVEPTRSCSGRRCWSTY
jgi:threonine/homoserine/homoserine lactone efflux protein